MSVICLRYHNECIYNVTKPPDVVTEPKQKVMKLKKGQTTGQGTNKLRLRLERSKFSLIHKKPHGCMGLPKQAPTDPQDFLRKNTGKPPMPPAEIIDLDLGHHICRDKSKLPPIPPRDEALKEAADRKAKYKKQDFITKNIKIAVHMEPKEPARRLVVHHFGETRDITKGLEPQNLQTKVYGKIPPYLDSLIKVQKKNAQAVIDRSGIKQPPCRYITRDQREKLLGGLKSNWEELQRIYQGLPILTDTIPKINRKSKLETDLKQLEKDIVLIERHPYIYVYDDQDFI